MNRAQVLGRVASIRESIGDPESAHSAEDSLYFDVLAAIADGRTDDPAGIARAALRTAEMDFPRWCA